MTHKKIDWSDVDWRRKVVDIAKEKGCGVQRVFRRRDIYVKYAKVFCSECGSLLNEDMLLERANRKNLCVDCFLAPDPDMPVYHGQSWSMIDAF